LCSVTVDNGKITVDVSTVNRQGEKSVAAGPGDPYRWAMGTTNWAQRAIEIGDRKGLSQTAIGQAVGKGRGWIGRIAAGKSSGLVEDAVGVADFLGVSLDVLCRDEVPWLKSADGLPLGFPHEDDLKTLVRLIDALGIGYDEAMRRVASPAPARGEVEFVAERRLSGASGHPSGPEPADPPTGPRRRVKRRG
jgi:transcriptional regulator with XRE-family HTH domain